MTTEGLEPTTAKAMEILAAVDLLAENERSRRFDPQAIRLWTLVLVCLCLILLSFGYLQLAQTTRELRAQEALAATQRQRIEALNSEIADCLTPQGKCAKRGADSQQAAVDQIVHRLALTACRVAIPDAKSDNDPRIARCVSRAGNARS